MPPSEDEPFPLLELPPASEPAPVEEPEPGLEVMLAEYPDSVVFASDYPHADGTFPGSTDALLSGAITSAAARRGNTSPGTRRRPAKRLP